MAVGSCCITSLVQADAFLEQAANHAGIDHQSTWNDPEWRTRTLMDFVREVSDQGWARATLSNAQCPIHILPITTQIDQ